MVTVGHPCDSAGVLRYKTWVDLYAESSEKPKVGTHRKYNVRI